MKASDFIVEELRAIRGAGSDKRLVRRTREQDLAPEWQEEIERVQQTLRDVIRAVCRLSGVELPAPGSDGSDEKALLPLESGESFKDRIRSDLEAYSKKTATELMRQAEEQTRGAMGVLQNEFKLRVDLLASQLREGLLEQFRPEQVDVCISQDTRDRVAEIVDAQTDDFARWVWLCCKGKGRPVESEVEAMLEPCTQQVTDSFLSAFRQNVQELVADQQQVVAEKLQVQNNSIAEQVEEVRQNSLQLFENDALAVRQKTVEHLNGVAEGLLKGIAEQAPPELDVVFGGFQQRMDEAVVAAGRSVANENEKRESEFRQRLEALATEVKEKSMAEVASGIEEITANAIGPSVEHLHHQANDSLEHSREEIRSFMNLQVEEARVKIEEIGVSSHEALLKDTAQAVQNLQGLEEAIAEVREKQLAISQEQLTSGVMESLDFMTDRIRQIASERIEEVNRHVRETQVAAAGQYSARLKQATENCLHDVVGRIWQEAGEAGAQASEEFKVNARVSLEELSAQIDASREALRRETAEATNRVQSALHESLESYRQQLSEVDNDGLKRKEQILKGGLRDLRNRLMEAANLLVPEESAAPQPDVADAIV